MFYVFSSQEERRKFGGSDFLEIRFCTAPREANLKIIVDTDSVKHWRDDSLYVSGDELDAFLREYDGVFDSGVYNNLETGPTDVCGINYYAPDAVGGIIEKLLKIKPTDYERLVKWLKTAEKYNGFYILGV